MYLDLYPELEVSKICLSDVLLKEQSHVDLSAHLQKFYQKQKRNRVMEFLFTSLNWTMPSSPSSLTQQ